MLDETNKNKFPNQLFFPIENPNVVYSDAYKIDNFNVLDKSNKKKSSKIIFILAIFLFLVCGFFGFWYYKGEAMFLISEMKFPWGTDIKNYSNTTKINIEFQKVDAAELSEFLNSFIGSDVDGLGSIDVEFDLKNVGENTESYMQFALNGNSIIKLFVKTFGKESIYSKMDLSANIPFLTESKDQWVYYSTKQESTDLLTSYLNKILQINLSQKENKSGMIYLLNFFDISDPHNTKNINNQSAKEIKLKIKKDKTIDLVLLSVKNSSSDDTYNKLYNRYKNYKDGKDEEFGKGVDILNSLSDKIDISVFVDKKTKVIDGIYLYIDDVDILKLINPKNDNSQKINTTLSMEFSELKNYIIEEPQNVISMEDIVNNFNDDNFIEVAELKDSDNDGLLNMYEEKYNSDINNSDTDKDGYIDGFEVINGYNPNGPGELNDDKNIFYFAYGTAMNMENMIDLYGEGNFISFGSSVLNGYDFYFYKDTSSNIKVSKDKNVYGVLYKINEKLLNVMEKSSLVLYNKNILKVKNSLGEFDTIVYTAKDSTTTSVPDLYYFTALVSGAKQNGLPEDYINLLNSYSSNKINIKLLDENLLKLKADANKVLSDIRMILMALQMYYVDTGIIPESIKSGDCLSDNNEICKTASKCNGLIDLSILINERILTSIPINPIKTNKGTGYFISRDSQNNITVCANGVESDEPISFTEKLISK